MKNIIDKLTLTAKNLGIDLVYFPGILVSLLITFFIFEDNKTGILEILNLNVQSEIGQEFIISILAIVSSIFLWFNSGSILDPVYDRFSFQNRNNPSDLKTRRKEARNKLSIDNNSYMDESKGIYTTIKQKLKESNSDWYSTFKHDLVISKCFRQLVLPLLMLVIYKIFFKSEYIISALLFMITVGVLNTSFICRDKHLLTLYTWFTEYDDKKGSS